MTEEALAASDNSEQEPQNDNQESETLLNLNQQQEEETTQEPDPMPHLASEEDEKIDWGERPTWIPEDLWSADDGPDVEGAFKALEKVNKDYKELRTKMSQGLHKAPTDGEYARDVFTQANEAEDDEVMTSYIDLAKKHGISQEAFNDMASLYFDAVGAAEDFAKTSIEEEKGKLGRNADRIISETSAWLTKLSSSGVLSNNELESIANASTNATFITAINKIRQSYNEAPIPANEIQEGNQPDRAELDSMVADPRYGKDMTYTKKVEEAFYKAYGEA